MRHDAHNYKRRIERIFHRIEKNKQMPIRDIEVLKNYKDYLISEGISLGRVGKYLSDLKKASILLNKRFEEADENDIRRIVSKFDSNEELSPWSKRDFKVAIRKFYVWLRGTNEYPPEVSWMKVYKKIKNTKTHEDLLTEEEIKKLIDFARSNQEKAFISTLYESGCRIGEIIHMKINDVKFDEYGAQNYVNGKTGFRRIRIVSSVPYLVDWLNIHPFKGDPEAFLWLSNRLKPFSYGGIAGMLYRIARRAGINKRMNPHNFRHSRATYLANFLTEAQMKEFFGWAQDSKMAAVYIHLSGRDVDNALLKIYGIENKNDNKESIFKPKECSRCHHINQATHKFCSICGMPLDREIRDEIVKKSVVRKSADKAIDNLLEDEEFREMFCRKMYELKSLQEATNPAK